MNITRSLNLQVFVGSDWKNDLQSTCTTPSSTYSLSSSSTPPSTSNPYLIFATFSHITLVFVQSLFQPSLSQFRHIHILTTLSTSPWATSNPYPTSISIHASSLTHPSSKIQFLKHRVEISEHRVEVPEHPVEPLQTSCRSSRMRFLDSQTL